MGGTPFESTAQASKTSENSASPPAQISFYNILNSSRGQTNPNQDHFRDELRRMQLDFGLLHTDGVAAGRGWQQPNQLERTGPSVNLQPDARQIGERQSTSPAASKDATQVTAGSSTDLANIDIKRVTPTGPSPFMQGLSDWSIRNLNAGLYGAAGARLALGAEVPMGKIFRNALTISATVGGADMGLDYLFPSVGGHHLFKPNSIDTIGAAVAAAVPTSDLRVRAGVVGASWLGGRIYNYFEN